MHYLITTITQSLMAYIAARGAKALFSGSHAGICGSRGKAMTRVVTVLAIKVASEAKIVILTLKAMNEIVLDEYYHMVKIVDERGGWQYKGEFYLGHMRCKYGWEWELPPPSSLL